MKTIAVYGSLKKDRYNHPLLSGQVFLGETVVSGTLYSMGSYPALVEEGNTIYPAEMYQVDENVYGMIRGMELGAGYVEREVECTHLNDGTVHTCIVYYAGESLSERCKKTRPQIEEY